MTEHDDGGATEAAADPVALATRVRRSFDASVGSIVFGMEDGAVSIFGLVFDVAASAPRSSPSFAGGSVTKPATAAAPAMPSVSRQHRHVMGRLSRRPLR